MKKIIFLLFILSFVTKLTAQVTNDDCVNSTPITLDATGNACITSTTLNALTTSFDTHPCWPTLQDIPDVWFSYVATGADNVITVTPTGGTPAQQLAVTITDGVCGSGSLDGCDVANSNGAAATVSWTYQIGTTVWVNVGSLVSQGSFQICVSSTNQPDAPGNSCNTATIVCDKGGFSLSPFPNNTNGSQPPCFGDPLQRPVFYQFTVGQSGTLGWTATLQGEAEYDWAIYDITGGCFGTEIDCNYNYTGDIFGNNENSVAVGMQNGVGGEFSNMVNVTAGNTYLLIIDNFSDNNIGFDLTWGGTFTIAPNPSFTMSSNSSCTPPLNVSFTNTSTTTVSQTWNFGNGNTSTAVTPPVQTYTASGTYIATLVGTSATGCQNIYTQNITIGETPTVTVPTNTTVCAGATISAANFSSVPEGATYTWTNSNTAIGLGASGNANIPSFTATNTTTSPITATITVTPTFNGCVGLAESYEITVDPTPVLTAIPNQSICVGNSTTAINFVVNPAGSIIDWTNSNPDIGIGASGSGDIASFAGVNSGTASISGNFTATPTFNSCPGTARNFTITINPASTPSAGSDSPECVNGTINFNASGGTSYSWAGPNGFTSLVQNPSITNVSAAAAGTYTVTVTDINSCIVTATTSIIINPLPTPNAGSDSPECVNGTINFTGSGAVSYSWAGPNGFSSALQNPSITLVTTAASGTYTLTATDANTCVGTSTTDVTINPLPTATISSNSPVCVNSNINLTAGGGTSYSWTGPDGYSSLVQNPSRSNAAIPMAGNYTVVVNDGNCEATATTNVVINPLPVVFIGSNTPVCENATINLTASGGVSYSWLGPLAFSSNTQNPSITNATLTMAGSYTVTATDANNCVNANVTSVIINPIPSSPTTIPITYCQNDLANALTASTSAGGTLNWYGTNATGGTASTLAPTPLTSSPGSTSYFVSQSVNNCESPRASLNVNVNALPTAAILPVTPACAPLCDDFVATSNDNISIYNWNMGDGTSSVNNDTIQFCYNNAGTYDISIFITDANGCTNTVTYTNWVTVYENPQANFIYNPQPVTILEPTVTFSNTSIGSDIINYSWNFGDALNTTGSGESPEFTYLTSGSYNVELAVMTINGCVDTVYQTIIVLEDFTLYIPNTFSPNADGINDEFYPLGVGLSDERYSLLIFDRWGELIFSTTDLNEHWDGKRKGKNNVVQEDVYIYKLSCRSFNGRKITKSGHVNVIR